MAGPPVGIESADLEVGNGFKSGGYAELNSYEKNYISSDVCMPLAIATEAPKVVILSFRQLQLQRIASLQDKLCAFRDCKIDEETRQAEVDDYLRRYADAVRNYEHLSSSTLSWIPAGTKMIGMYEEVRLAKSPPTGFIDRLCYNLIIVWTGGSGRLWTWFESKAARAGYLPKHIDPNWGTADLTLRELDQKGRRERERKKAFASRITMAMFGGVALIVPMLIMTLHPSRNKSLITVSVATILFALALAVCATDERGKDVLAATGAYTAVLVVFVGTSTGTG